MTVDDFDNLAEPRLVRWRDQVMFYDKHFDPPLKSHWRSLCFYNQFHDQIDHVIVDPSQCVDDVSPDEATKFWRDYTGCSPY